VCLVAGPAGVLTVCGWLAVLGGLAGFVMEMTRPAVAVSVLRAAAAGWLPPGTKMIQRVLRRPGRYCGRSRIS
jgi:hypothetical protein